MKNLVEISNYFGKKPEYVIAGGGNTSVKDENFLWIKASGTSLANINAEGFVKMNRNGLWKISKKKYSLDPLKRESEIKEDLSACIAEKTEKRPSVETSLHNLLNFKYVVHTHPTLVNGLMCSKNCAAETRKIFGDTALVVEYTDPGYVLYKAVEKKIEMFIKKFGTEPQIIFLDNHGLIVAGGSTIEIKELYKMIFKKIGTRIKEKLPSSSLIKNNLQLISESLQTESRLIAKAFNSLLIQEYIHDKKSFKQVETAFTPDDIVYCKAHYLFCSNNLKDVISGFRKYLSEYGFPPKVIAIEKSGIICLEESEQSLKIVYEIFLNILKVSWYSRNFGGPRFMTPGQIAFIDTWEVENYRRKIAKKMDGLIH